MTVGVEGKGILNVRIRDVTHCIVRAEFRRAKNGPNCRRIAAGRLENARHEPRSRNEISLEGLSDSRNGGEPPLHFLLGWPPPPSRGARSLAQSAPQSFPFKRISARPPPQRKN